jgi:hypothetical protein
VAEPNGFRYIDPLRPTTKTKTAYPLQRRLDRIRALSHENPCLSLHATISIRYPIQMNGQPTFLNGVETAILSKYPRQQKRRKVHWVKAKAEKDGSETKSIDYGKDRLALTRFDYRVVREARGYREKRCGQDDFTSNRTRKEFARTAPLVAHS